MSKIINRACIGTKESFHRFASMYPTAIKIEDAEVYWCDNLGVFGIIASDEWREYLVGEREILPIETEN